ncbi:MAG: Helix-turn-helix domain protein [Candidatus Bathyarchaeota archaeon BA1]|nr:MAG: Helix-turn-helix domain protein [Candidatus Bathyarchaeota archaeon BA1]
MYSKKEFNGYKICEALSLPTRVRILQELIKAYPNKLTVSKLQEKTSEPRMTIWFHLEKLREANLAVLNCSGKGFRAATKALTIRFNGNGVHLEETE